RSNVLTLTILPDDPSWDDRELDSVLRELNRATESGDNNAQTSALHRLAMLDTPRAMDERIARIPVLPFDRAREGECAPLPRILFESSTRPALLVNTFATKAQAPDFGVQCNFAEAWISALVRRNRPDLFVTTGTVPIGGRFRASIVNGTVTLYDSRFSDLPKPTPIETARTGVIRELELMTPAKTQTARKDA